MQDNIYLHCFLLHLNLFRCCFLRNFRSQWLISKRDWHHRPLLKKFISPLWTLLYALIVTIWGRFNKAAALKAEEPRVKSKKHHHNHGESTESSRFSFFNCLVIAHNVLLTVFSAYCFVYIVKILLDSYIATDFFDAVSHKMGSSITHKFSTVIEI